MATALSPSHSVVLPSRLLLLAPFPPSLLLWFGERGERRGGCNCSLKRSKGLWARRRCCPRAISRGDGRRASRRKRLRGEGLLLHPPKKASPPLLAPPEGDGDLLRHSRSGRGMARGGLLLLALPASTTTTAAGISTMRRAAAAMAEVAERSCCLAPAPRGGGERRPFAVPPPPPLPLLLWLWLLVVLVPEAVRRMPPPPPPLLLPAFSSKLTGEVRARWSTGLFMCLFVYFVEKTIVIMCACLTITNQSIHT